MLTRAAQRQRRLRDYQNFIASYSQLQLPWLCPAVSSSIKPSQRLSTLQSRSPRACSLPSTCLLSSNPQKRPLATIAEPSTDNSADSYTPFVDLPTGLRHKDNRQRVPGPSLTSLRSFPVSDVVRPSTDVYEAPPRFKTGRLTGITGNVEDLQHNLYACVQVGRLDRAAMLVRRLAAMLNPTAPELQDCHHRYISGMLDSLLRNPSNDTFTAMQKWFELDIKAVGVPLNSAIIAIMLQAAFVTLQGSRLDRTLRRYLNYARQIGPEVEDEALASEIFTDSQWSRMVRQLPDRYEPPVEVIEEHDIPSIVSSEGLVISENERRYSASPTSRLPEIRPTEQKGSGLKFLMQSLESLYSDKINSTEESSASPEHIRQCKLEEDVLDTALKRWHEDSEITQAARARGQLESPSLGSYIHEWITAMVPLLKKEMEDAEAAESMRVSSEQIDNMLIAPFLKMLTPEKICATAILGYFDSLIGQKSVLGELRTSDLPVSKFATVIGRNLIKEMKAETLQNHLLQTISGLPSSKRRQQLARLMKNNRNAPPQQAMTDAKAEYAQNTQQGAARRPMDISADVHLKLGALMISLILKVAKLPVTRKDPRTGQDVVQVQPVAAHAPQWKNGKRYGMIRTNVELLERLKREPAASLVAKFLPMLVEPRPWTGLTEGAYLRSNTKAVRFKDTSQSQREYVSIADKRGDLKQVYAGLDVIGKVRWRVNRDLLAIMTDVWNTGEHVGKFAPENPTADYPPEPAKDDRSAHRRWANIVRTIDNEVTAWHSQRCYQNFQLEIARAFANDDFYCPHSVDFRGRAYPIPPYFNHMGPDYIRGLFLFAEGKELGEGGLRWLKIHLANVFGFDKESLSDREAFASDHITEIYESAENPLNGNKWWLKADDPWQCLAACMELKNALDSPIPHKYVSHLPVQQDGSCNGLQHYAALGGDEIGAQQVNLAPGDKPADVYNAVASIVKAKIEKDFNKGVSEAMHLHGKITRKVVKQPVMTNVYGVTFHGAALQVRKQLADILPKATLDNEIHLGKLSHYVATLIFQALSEMFSGAHDIQKWLGVCGGQISQAVTPEQIQRIEQRRAGNLPTPQKHIRKQIKSQIASTYEDYQFKSTIVWTTPLGLPVVQPYRQPKTRLIRTNLQEISVMIASLSDPVSKRKQLQAFPPNFIHSLDATHMMLSALKCDEIGLNFAAVHDSFWTHASDVPTMNRVLRDAFIRMHSEDVIGRLHEEFLARYKGCLHYTAINANSALGQKIGALYVKQGKAKRHFRSLTVTHEHQVDALLEEHTRLTLLRSEDPADRARGKAMVTPGSIFESEKDLVDVSVAPIAISLLGQQPAIGARLVDPNARSDVEILSSADGVFSDTVQDEVEAEPSKGPKPGRRQAREERIHLWVPLEFPAPPAKGTFDVSRLMDSQYFFS